MTTEKTDRQSNNKTLGQLNSLMDENGDVSRDENEKYTSVDELFNSIFPEGDLGRAIDKIYIRVESKFFKAEIGYGDNRFIFHTTVLDVKSVLRICTFIAVITSLTLGI